MRFQNFAVLGTGTLALFCAAELQARELPVTLYEMDAQPSDFLRRRARGQGLCYEHQEPGLLFETLSKAAVPTLLISAINPYILPEYLLENPMITAINCHQALLPAHPGRNAEMWAIFEGDKKTGITWHMLTAQVDAGDILVQKEMELTRRHTSYQVFREQILLAQEGFAQLLPGLLAGTVKARVQNPDRKRRMHYSKDVPNGGMLNPDWDAEQISAFLRAMDYSILNVVPRPRLQADGQEFIIKKYKMISEQRYPDGMFPEDKMIYLQKPGELFELTLQREGKL